jgi:hypothetical protein
MGFLVGVVCGAVAFWFVQKHGERAVSWFMGKVGGH